MRQPYELSIAARYLRTRRTTGFITLLAWISIVGVTIGVAALIVVPAVMNGFESELRNRLVSLTAQATVSGPPESLAEWQALAARIGSGFGCASGTWSRFSGGLACGPSSR